MPVVIVEPRGGRAARDPLAHAFQPQHVLLRGVAGGLGNDLCVARGVLRVHQIGGLYARHGLRGAVAVSVVDDGDSALLDQVILEVVGIAEADGSRGIPVGVVGV